MTPVAFLMAVLFVLALHMWINASRRISRIGIPEGRVAYQDADRRRAPARPLVSHRHGLTGKPDYLVETTHGVVPVEVKSRECASAGPYAGETAQLTAYCVLLEDTIGVAPTHGIVQYANRPWRIPYTRHSRDRVLQIVGQIREARGAQSVHRNHTQPGRCRACGFRSVCDEQLE
jgi:CRISPR-associated exonuclease Cas4